MNESYEAETQIESLEQRNKIDCKCWININLCHRMRMVDNNLFCLLIAIVSIQQTE